MGWLNGNSDEKTQEVHLALQTNDGIQTAILITLLVIKFIELMLYFSSALKKTIGRREQA